MTMSSQGYDVDLTIIVPVLNEANGIDTALRELLAVTAALRVEILVVDGGSADNTLSLAGAHPVTVVSAPRGRANQMNAGAARARGGYLLFLHVDTRLPQNLGDLAAAWLEARPVWGFFTLRLSGDKWQFRLIEKGINLRSRLFRTATGDQAFYCRRQVFDQVGGFPDIALMEDVALCRTLNKLIPPTMEPASVVTSSRRWEKRGICRTVLQMWALRLAYYSGVSPMRLARIYYPTASRKDDC